MRRQGTLFPRQRLGTYRVLPGKVFIHPRTGERISAGAHLHVYPHDVEGQEDKLVRFPVTTRQIDAEIEKS